MATNTLVVYGMVMSSMNIRPRSDFLKVALVLGAISILGAVWQSILGGFVTFLFLISALFVPVFAIMVVDYYVLRRRRYAVADLLAARGGAYWFSGGVNPVAIASFVVGAGPAYSWTRVSPLPVGATIPSFAVTFVLHLVLSLALGAGARAAPPTAPRSSSPPRSAAGGDGRGAARRPLPPPRRERPGLPR